MIGSILFVSVLAMQASPAAKPSTPIAVVADAGPSVEVPAELAALTGPDTIAVLFLPDAEAGDRIDRRLRETMGPVAASMPLGASFLQMTKQGLRTDLEIPGNQPVLWWIDMPAAEGDEPPMGMAEFTFRQAIRIPGAEAAMAKAKVDAANAADTKARPVMPIRARARRSSIRVLPGDIVVVSSEAEPFQPSPKAQPSPLVKALPKSEVCGRVDLSRLLAEQGDQLRMLSGFASMGLMGGMDEGGEGMSDQEKRQKAMRQQLADGVGRQIDDVIDTLMQLKRATFAISLEGDEFVVWADWSRDAAFPKGLSAATAESLATALPPGLNLYFGLSSNAIGVLYGERIRIDDSLATLGATPEQVKAYEESVTHARRAVGQILDGAVGGLGGQPSDLTGLAAFKVKDAAAFRDAVKSAAAGLGRAGLAQVKVEERGELLTMVITPDSVRVKDIMEFFAPGLEDAEAVREATVASTVALRFKGDEVLVTHRRGETPLDPATLVRADVRDLREGLAARAWGTADWFGVADLRPTFAQAMSDTAEAMAKVGTTEDHAKRMEAAKAVANGKPLLLRLWQGVQGGTARLTVRINLADWAQLVEDVAKAQQAGLTPAEDAVEAGPLDDGT